MFRIVCFLLTCACCQAETDKPIVFGFPHFPPWYETLANGESVGVAIDIVKRIEAAMQHEFLYRELPHLRFYKDFEQGTVSFSVHIKTPELVASGLFGSAPIAANPLAIYSLSNLDDFNDIADLAGLRVGHKRGYGYLGRIQQLLDPRNRIAVHDLNNRLALFKMLAAGRLDAVIAYTGPARTLLQQHNIGPFQHRIIDRNIVYFVVSKNAVGAEQLLARLEQHFRALGEPVKMP